MPFEWDKKAATLLRNQNAMKILATSNRWGSPHIESNAEITLDEDDTILYREYHETSQTGSNLVYSLWFGRNVAVYTLLDDVEFEIQCIPVRSIVSGPIFEAAYQEALEQDTIADLAAIWVLSPKRITDENCAAQEFREKNEHPLVMHLDHLGKKAYCPEKKNGK